MPEGLPNSSAAEPLRIRIERSERGTIVEVSGELDVATRPGLQDTIEDLLRSGVRQLVIDLRPLAFMDSAGIGLLFAPQPAEGARRLCAHRRAQ